MTMELLDCLPSSWPPEHPGLPPKDVGRFCFAGCCDESNGPALRPALIHPRCAPPDREGEGLPSVRQHVAHAARHALPPGAEIALPLYPLRVLGRLWVRRGPHFDFIGDFSTHYGIYEGMGALGGSEAKAVGLTASRSATLAGFRLRHEHALCLLGHLLSGAPIRLSLGRSESEERPRESPQETPFQTLRQALPDC